MERSELLQLSLGEIVANDFRSASVFKEAGLDFCCGGKKSLDGACREIGLDTATVVNALEALGEAPVSPSLNFKEWDIQFLADYIVNTHHKYVKKALPELRAYTVKIAQVHGQNHAELLEVESLFEIVANELVPHLKMEEEVLFPAIKRALKAESQRELDEAKATISAEIARMSVEHESAGGAMDKINEITQGYRLPADACNTYSLTFKLLEQFEDDLHIHVHLENNILFPKALQLK